MVFHFKANSCCVCRLGNPTSGDERRQGATDGNAQARQIGPILLGGPRKVTGPPCGENARLVNGKQFALAAKMRRLELAGRINH